MITNTNKQNLKFTYSLLNVFNPIFSYEIKNKIYCKVNKKYLKNLLLFLRDHTNTLFKELIDCYGIDYN